MNGRFCVIEGIDGSGKSTLIQALAERLRRESNFDLLLLREPTNGAYGRRIREHLGRRDDLPRNEWLELFMKDRAENVAGNIEPALTSGRLILQDRYFYSTAAYQGFEDDPPGPAAIVAASLQRGFPEPHVLLYLDIEPERALERVHAGRESTESFETLEQLRRIHANYEKILPDWTTRLDANMPPEELSDRAFKIISKT